MASTNKPSFPYNVREIVASTGQRNGAKQRMQERNALQIVGRNNAGQKSGAD